MTNQRVSRKRKVFAGPWTEKELEVLRNTYPDQGADACVVALGGTRTRAAIVLRVSILGLKLTHATHTAVRRDRAVKACAVTKNLVPGMVQKVEKKPEKKPTPVHPTRPAERVLAYAKPTEIVAGMVINRYPRSCSGVRPSFVRVNSALVTKTHKLQWFSLSWSKIDGSASGVGGWNLLEHPDLSFELYSVQREER